VLGDSTAKSESMSKSLERMEAYAALELDYQNSMLTALRNIETALGGAAKGIMQTAGITGGSGFGTVNSSSSNFFGSDKTTTIDDTGVKFSGTFGALRAGQGRGVQYEDVIKTSDGGWFHGDSTTKSTNTKALSAEAMKPFALIFDNMGDLLVDAGVKLGKDGATLTNAINGISVDFEVSLRDLKGQELTDALNAGVSVAFDKVTKELFPTIAQFQKMGEGIGETLVRVATDVKAVDSVFASMGKTATGLYSSAGKMASILNGMTVEAKERLVELSGGLDAFASSAKSFMQNFYTEAEQIKAQKAKLNPVLAQYGLSTEGADAEAHVQEIRPQPGRHHRSRRQDLRHADERAAGVQGRDQFGRRRARRSAGRVGRPDADVGPEACQGAPRGRPGQPRAVRPGGPAASAEGCDQWRLGRSPGDDRPPDLDQDQHAGLPRFPGTRQLEHADADAEVPGDATPVQRSG
jgi:hypothetical protein